MVDQPHKENEPFNQETEHSTAPIDTIEKNADELHLNAESHNHAVQTHTDKLNVYIDKVGQLAQKTKVITQELQGKLGPKVASFIQVCKEKLAEANEAVKELRQKQQTATTEETAAKTDNVDSNNPHDSHRAKPE